MVNFMHELIVYATCVLAFCSSHCAHFCRRIETADLAAVRAAVGPKTKFVWIESPTNPRQQISDIRVMYYCSLCS